MDTRPSLLIIGYTNIDINITPTKTTTLPGGAGYFAALAASLITQPIGFVTRIGTDFDPSLLLSRILPDGIHIIPDKPTARSIQRYHSDTDLTQRDISLKWGVAPDLCPEDIPREWTDSIQYIHIGTMHPDQQARFLSWIRSHMPKTTISIDTDHYLFSFPGYLEKIQENFRSADIIFLNRNEYAELRNITDTHPFSIVKQDKDGANILHYGKETYRVQAETVEPVDVTGAGDVLAGVFLASLSKGIPEADALKIAVSFATQSITQEGILHLFI